MILFGLMWVPFIIYGMSKIEYNQYNAGLIVIACLYFVSTKILSPFKNRQLAFIEDQTVGKLVLEDNSLFIYDIETSTKLKVDIESKVKLNIKSIFNKFKAPRILTSEKSYGTDSTFKLIATDKKYYLFLKDETDKQNLLKISSWAINNVNNYEEFTNGERTYSGKKLTYSEIQKRKDYQ